MSDSLNIDVSMQAGPLRVTGNTSDVSGHQTVVRGDLGGCLYLYFTPELAKQWISALAPIATSEPL